MLLVHISFLIVTFSLPCIMGFAIDANHQRSQLTPTHCTTCQCVECLLLIVIILLLEPLVELSVHGFATLPGKAKLTCEDGSFVMVLYISHVRIFFLNPKP